MLNYIINEHIFFRNKDIPASPISGVKIKTKNQHQAKSNELKNRIPNLNITSSSHFKVVFY